MKIIKISALISTMIVTLLFVPAMTVHDQGSCQSAFAEELWKQEFMELCSKTDEAMSLTKDELKIMLQKGDKLKPVIEQQDETTRKVFIKRLQKCVNLYAFVLESKAADKKQ